MVPGCKGLGDKQRVQSCEAAAHKRVKGGPQVRDYGVDGGSEYVWVRPESFSKIHGIMRFLILTIRVRSEKRGVYSTRATQFPVEKKLCGVSIRGSLTSRRRSAE